MAKFKQIRVPCDKEVWSKNGCFYIVEGYMLVKMVGAYRAVLTKRYADGDNFNSIYRTTETVPVEGIVDGHDGWQFLHNNWIDELNTAYNDFVAKNEAKLVDIFDHIRALRGG